MFQPCSSLLYVRLTEAIAKRTSLLSPLQEIPDLKSRIATVALRFFVAIALEVTTTIDLLHWIIKAVQNWHSERLSELVKILAAFVFNFGMCGGFRLIPQKLPTQALVNCIAVRTINRKHIPVEISTILNSPAYIAWKCSYVKLLHCDSIQEYINGDENMKKYVCPLTKYLPETPVRIGYGGDTFECNELIRQLIANSTMSPSGFARIFSIENLRLDLSHVLAVRWRLIDLYKENDKDTKHALMTNLDESLPKELKTLVYSYVAKKDDVDLENESSLWSELHSDVTRKERRPDYLALLQ